MPDKKEEKKEETKEVEVKIAKGLEGKINKQYKVNPKCLMFKYVTDEMLEKYKKTKTKSGFTLEKAINSGVQNPDSGVGIYAGDEQSYTAFRDVFDKIIEDYHGYTPSDKHKTDMDPAHLTFNDNPDPEGKFINSTRIRVGRNLAGYALNPNCSAKDRAAIEKKIVAALNTMPGDLAGKYYSLGGMTDAERDQLIEDHFLFKKGDRFLEAAGCNKDWPKNRGIFHNNEKTFLVWVNEEDQLRIISMQPGGDIKAVFERLSRAVAHLEKTMKFSHDSHLGVISSCPTNLGTAMRASVHIKVPNLAKNKELFETLCDQMQLQPRGIHGEHSETTGGVFDISNKRRLGLSEVDCANQLYDGVQKLIELESKGPDGALKAMKETSAALCTTGKCVIM